MSIQLTDVLLGIIIWFQFIRWYKDSVCVDKFKSWNDLRKRKKKVPKRDTSKDFDKYGRKVK